MDDELQVGDTVYHLYGGGFGDPPCIHKGKITAISNDYYHVGPGHTVMKSRCYKDIHDLLNALRDHINEQTTEIDNCVYLW